MHSRAILTMPTRGRAIEAGVNVDLENDSEELERLSAGEDGDIRAAEPFSRRHPWEHGFFVLFQNFKLMKHRDFAPQ